MGVWQELIVAVAICFSPILLLWLTVQIFKKKNTLLMLILHRPHTPSTQHPNHPTFRVILLLTRVHCLSSVFAKQIKCWQITSFSLGGKKGKIASRRYKNRKVRLYLQTSISPNIWNKGRAFCLFAFLGNKKIWNIGNVSFIC